MLPIKALRREEHTPIITYVFIALNVLVFIWELSQGARLGQTFYDLAVVPCRVGNNFLSIETVLDFLRTMFFHGSLLHIVGNMIFLAVFGPHIEGFMGRRWYTLFYLLAGFLATFAHVVFNSHVCVPVVGASGAISGLLGSYLLLYPTIRIRTFGVVAFRRLPIPIGTADIHAFFMLIYMFLVDLIDGIGALGASSVGGVAVWAHVGGFVTGAVFTFFFTAFVRPLPRWPSPFDGA